MDLKEIQNRIVNFSKLRASKKEYDLTPELVFIHLTEELGEIARQLSSKRMRPEKFDEENLKEEIVDVILESFVLANLCDVDLEKELAKKIEILFQKHEFKEK